MRCLLTFFLLPMAAEADTVTLLPSGGAGPAYTVECTVVDHRGDAIVIKRESGGEKTYPASRVVGIETDWPAGYTEGLEAIAARDWARGAERLAAAARVERRAWARRRVLTELLRCEAAVGRVKRAGDLLIAIDASDPTTRAWSLAPLPWFASDEVSAGDARAWLARSEPSARLLGAAWLLSTSERPAARSMLQQLARSGRPAIARLAEAQLWRLDLPRADAAQTGRWAERLATTPGFLRAGPQHVLAQAYRRQKRYDEAALVALESPLRGMAPHRLSARGLLLAGRALQAAGRSDEARTLLEEVVRDYADTPQRRDAESLLEQ